VTEVWAPLPGPKELFRGYEPVRVQAKRTVTITGFLAAAALCRSQVPIHSAQPETSQLRIDILNRLGDQISGAQAVLSETKQLLSTGRTYDLKPGAYLLTAAGAGEGTERRILVTPGYNHIVITYPFVSVIDASRQEVELVFSGVQSGCRSGYLQQFADIRALQVSFRLTGDRVVAGPLEHGVYLVHLFSDQGICGVSAFVHRGHGQPIPVRVARVGQALSKN